MYNQGTKVQQTFILLHTVLVEVYLEYEQRNFAHSFTPSMSESTCTSIPHCMQYNIVYYYCKTCVANMDTVKGRMRAELERAISSALLGGCLKHEIKQALKPFHSLHYVLSEVLLAMFDSYRPPRSPPLCKSYCTLVL